MNEKSLEYYMPILRHYQGQHIQIGCTGFK